MTTDDLIVLFGGDSGERRVSVASAQHIVEVLGECEPWFLSPEGSVHRVTSADLARHARPFETDFVPASPPVFSSLAAALDAAPRDAVFVLALHGGAGEDGTVQRELEVRGLAFTGSGSAASARAFDKRAAKEVALARGVAVAESIVLPRGDAARAREALAAFVARTGRAVVKPVADGSSVGLHHVRSPDDVEPVAAAVGAQAAVAYLAEAFVEGTELTVGVVDFGEGPRALPASEVRVLPGRAFDFEGKYLGKGTIEITPAEVPTEVSSAARALALTMHVALGCEGYSRTDVIASARGPVFLETNTLPGLTRASFLPQQLAAEGVSVGAFLAAQVSLARRRRAAERAR